jgi:hypothetical protein
VEWSSGPEGDSTTASPKRRLGTCIAGDSIISAHRGGPVVGVEASGRSGRIAGHGSSRGATHFDRPPPGSLLRPRGLPSLGAPTTLGHLLTAL